MKLLLVHNYYAQKGGEDAVFAQERDLLRENGHEVLEYTKHNLEIKQESRVKLALNAIWSKGSFDHILKSIDHIRPDIIHIHNTLPQISPSIYDAAWQRKVPVVQTLHNYRLICANGLLLRRGAVCEDCLHKILPWPAVLHKCYRGDRAATLSVVATVGLHRAAGTWRRKVAKYIALCEFARNKILAAGIPEERVVVKPNFVVDRHPSISMATERSGALFVGRLSVEKGVDTILQAWRQMKINLRIIGTGNLESSLRASAPDGVEFLGFAGADAIAREMRKASFLVIPSRFYEGFPMVLAEAFSAGLPVVASRLGALAELVDDGITGLHFNPGDAADLATKVQWAAAHQDSMAEMGYRARQTYERAYTPSTTYRSLMKIYRDARTVSQAS